MSAHAPYDANAIGAAGLLEAVIIRRASTAFPGIVGIRRVLSPRGIALFELTRAHRLPKAWAAVGHDRNITIWLEPPRL